MEGSWRVGKETFSEAKVSSMPMEWQAEWYRNGMLYPPEGCVIRKLCLQPWAADMLVFRPVGAVRWKSLLILKALWRKFALGHLCSLFQHTAELWVHKIYFNFGWSQTCNKKPSRVRGGNEAMGRRNRHEAAVCSICSVRLQRRGFGERPIECTFTPKPERHQACYSEHVKKSHL